MLGLFIPLQQGAWSPSTWPRSTSWSFEYNAECTISQSDVGRCERAGDAYKQRWAQRMEWTRTTTLAQSMDRAQQFAGGKKSQ